MSRATCPHCSYTKFWNVRRGRRKCRSCHREFGASIRRSGVQASRSGWSKCITAFLRERTLMKVVEHSGIPVSRAAKMLHLLREAMTTDMPETFSGVCEADETFVGGTWANKPR